MNSKIVKLQISTLALFLNLGNLVAAPAALRLEHELNLDDYAGKTYLEAMVQDNTGIKANLDEDYEQQYTIANWNVVSQSLKNFDTKNSKRILSAFGNDQQEFRDFSEAIAGKSFTPSNIDSLIRKNYQGSGNIYALAQFYAMASGAGTLIHLNRNNYIYNYGYKSGASADDVKSGRSFGAGPNHNANDASDVMYLDELQDLLTSTRNPADFYKALMEVITQSDASEFSDLSADSQTVATDFVAIYTAELDRHVMVDLNPSRHPWENDLAEATFISVYAAASGKLIKDGELVDGDLREFWDSSEVSSGSGIGITRKDRRLLQKKVSDYMRNNYSNLVDELEGDTGGERSDGDTLRGVMEYINNYDTQRDVKHNAKKITSALVDYLVQVKTDADDITKAIQH